MDFALRTFGNSNIRNVEENSLNRKSPGCLTAKAMQLKVPPSLYPITLIWSIPFQPSR